MKAAVWALASVAVGALLMAPAISQVINSQAGGVTPSSVVACVNGNGLAAPCSSQEVCVTPKVTASSYTAGYLVGGLITIAIPPTLAAAQVLQSMRTDFLDAQTLEFDIYQLSSAPIGGASPSTFSDHQAPSIVAGDVFKVLPPIKLTSASSGLGTHTVYGQDAIGRALARTSINDYFLVVSVGTPTLGSIADMQFCASYL